MDAHRDFVFRSAHVPGNLIHSPAKQVAQDDDLAWLIGQVRYQENEKLLLFLLDRTLFGRGIWSKVSW